METTQSIGQRIKLVRGELSQKAFGLRIGLSQTAVTALETDQSEPRLGTFNSIVEAFKIDPEWLRTGVGEMKPVPAHIQQVNEMLTTVRQVRAQLDDQLPPPVPSEAKPTQPGGGESPLHITAEGEMYWRSVASERLKQIESLEKTLERLWKQNDTLLEAKEVASSDAAGFMYASTATPISMRPAACQPVLEVAPQPTADTCKVIALWPELEVEQAKAA